MARYEVCRLDTGEVVARFERRDRALRDWRRREAAGVCFAVYRTWADGRDELVARHRAPEDAERSERPQGPDGG